MLHRRQVLFVSLGLGFATVLPAPGRAQDPSNLSQCTPDPQGAIRLICPDGQVIQFKPGALRSREDGVEVDCFYAERGLKPGAAQRMRQLDELKRYVSGAPLKCYDRASIEQRKESPVPLQPQDLTEIPRKIVETTENHVTEVRNRPGDCPTCQIDSGSGPPTNTEPTPVILEKKKTRKKQIDDLKKNPHSEIKKQDTPAQRKKREEAKKLQRQKLGLGSPKPEDRPAPKDVPEALMRYTDNLPRSKELEVCVGLDSSGSMGDDVEFIHQKLPALQAGWQKKYGAQIRMTLIVYGQDKFLANPEMHFALRNQNPSALNAYLSSFKVGGSVEPTFDVIRACAQILSDPNQDPPDSLRERAVIIISDEVGDELVGSPSPQEARAAVDAKKAFFEWIDPDKIYSNPEPPYVARIQAGAVSARHAIVEDREGNGLLTDFDPQGQTGTGKPIGLRIAGHDMILAPDAKSVAILDPNDPGIRILDLSSGKTDLVGQTSTGSDADSTQKVRFLERGNQIVIQDPERRLVRIQKKDGRFSGNSQLVWDDPVDAFGTASHSNEVVIRQGSQFRVLSPGKQERLPQPNAKLSVIASPGAKFQVAGDGGSIAYSAGGRVWLWTRSPQSGWDLEEIPVDSSFRLLALTPKGTGLLGIDDSGTVLVRKETSHEGSSDWVAKTLFENEVTDISINPDQDEMAVVPLEGPPAFYPLSTLFGKRDKK